MLESLGWTILRIWSTDWWLDPEGEIEKISQRLKAILAVPEKGPAEMAPALSAVNLTANPSQAQSPLPVQSGNSAVAVDAGEGREQVLDIYRPVVLAADDDLLFHDADASATLVDHLTLVIEAQGPLTDTIFSRKVARAWGLERTGARVVERLRTLVPERFVGTI